MDFFKDLFTTFSWNLNKNVAFMSNGFFLNKIMPEESTKNGNITQEVEEAISQQVCSTPEKVDKAISQDVNSTPEKVDKDISQDVSSKPEKVDNNFVIKPKCLEYRSSNKNYIVEIVWTSELDSENVDEAMGFAEIINESVEKTVENLETAKENVEKSKTDLSDRVRRVDENLKTAMLLADNVMKNNNLDAECEKNLKQFARCLSNLEKDLENVKQSAEDLTTSVSNVGEDIKHVRRLAEAVKASNFDEEIPETLNPTNDVVKEDAGNLNVDMTTKE